MRRSPARLAPGWRRCLQENCLSRSSGPWACSFARTVDFLAGSRCELRCRRHCRERGWGGGTNRTEASWRGLEGSGGCGRGGLRSAQQSANSSWGSGHSTRTRGQRDPLKAGLTALPLSGPLPRCSFSLLPSDISEHDLGQTLGDGEGQGSLACCSPWGHKESDTTW